MSDKSLTIKELLANIDARISHIEDIEADNREIIIKLVKQGNQVVNFLKDLEIQEVEVENAFELPSTDKEKNKDKFKELKELVEEFMDKHKDLEELEEELKKHKDDIAPGKIGEA